MSLHQQFEGNEPLKALVNAAPITIIITDPTGHIVMVNNHVEAVFGYQQDELLGQPVEVLMPQRFRDLHVRDRSIYAKSPHQRAMGVGLELFGRRKDGTEFPIEVGLNAFKTDGETYLTAMVTDITRRKQLENEIHLSELLEVELKKEREIIELKERFISMISHELRNPLAMIMSSAGMLERYQEVMPQESKMKHVERILQHCREMANLLDDVLTLSRARAGVINLQPEETDLYRFCWNIYEEYALIDEGRHHFRFSCPDIQRVKIDRRVLRHVLFNLLANAVKYSPADTTVRFHVSQINEHLQFQVSDEGIGIPPDDLERIFDPFHRAKNALEYHGTGLGLAIVRQNVEAHGGQISCTSEVNQGTTFTVMLPIRP